MKKQLLKLKTLGLGLVLMIGLTNCSKDAALTDLGAQSLKSENALCGSDTCTLWAGQHIDAGTLIVSNDNTNLYVTYTTTGVFGTLHLWAGTDLTLVPATPNGTPIPGQFPYHYDASGTNSYTFTIPLANISFFNKCGDKINVIAHAEVEINGGSETAFGGCLPVNVDEPGRWYYIFEYTTACCETPPPPSKVKLGTAFAKGGYVFTTDKKSNPENLPSLNLTKNRWGWAINMKSAGTFTYNLWVGAGLNSTTKALKVGTATIDFDGSQAKISYNLFTNFAIEEAHIYAGDFAPSTIAPGQYGNTFYFDPMVQDFSTTVDVADSNGDGVWFILHAVAYGPGVTNP